MILNEYQKTTEIPEALRRYMEETGHTQADISRVSGVGASYLNHIAQGKMIVSNKNGGSEIKDKYYLMLCEAIQYPLKQEVWRHFNTYNFKQSINRIKSARTEKLRFTIDGDTGAGKTHACME